jgi:hypothetical protein
MKINLKKVASVLASTLMIGSTIGFAAAAWPEPFVKNGAGDAAIVVGTTIAQTDMSAATDLGTSLNAKVTSAGATTVTGDSIKLEKSSNKYNIGETMNTFYATLDEEELSKVLAAGTYMDDDNNEYDYEQSIAVGALNLTYFQNDDFNNEKPLVGFNLVDRNEVLNYTLEFTDNVKRGVLETSTLTMLGATYYVLDETNTSNGLKLTLLDNANSAIVSDGEAKTITVGDNTYAVDIVFIDSTDVILEVNGVKTNKLKEGDVFKVATDTYVAVKNILYNEKESGISQVEISVGSGKIVLEDGQEVQMNEKDISEDTDMILTSYFDNTTTELSEIKLQWTLDDDFWIAPGTDLVLPGFKTIKLSMTGFNQPKQEVTTLKASSDEIFEVTTTVKDGELKLPLFYNNNTEILGLGEKAKHVLVTDSGNTGTAITLNLTENSYFVVSYLDGDNSESYAYEIDSITENDGKNTTVLQNLAGGSDVSIAEVGKDKDIGDGNIKFTLTSASKDDKVAVITASESGSGELYLDRVFTKEGLTFRLPVDSTVGIDGDINISANPDTWTMNFTEETKDDNIMEGKSFTTALTINTDDGLEPSTVTGITTYETEDGSKKYEGYLVSPLATKILWDKPSSGLKTLDITYAGEESTADVYISEAASTVTGTNSVKVIKDSEIDSAKDKNLIVIGGSCINTVAAKILGKEAPVCGEDFTALTEVSATKYLIQVAASPYAAADSGKIAMLVAGYDAAETTLAAAKVKEGTVSTAVGTKEILPKATA